MLSVASKATYPGRRRWQRIGKLLPLACLVASFGCNSNNCAPVSGVVTLNGKPLPNAFVSFEPITENQDPAQRPRGSTGKTNDNGEYSLKTGTADLSGARDGALVGKHKVSIILVEPPPEVDNDQRRRPSS